jgi:hypothetical protein
MKIKDVTRQRADVIALINSSNQFKSVRIYKYKDNMMVKSIAHDNTIQVSSSTPNGPSDKGTIIDIFDDLTSKDISNFEISFSGSAIYFIENNIILN